jgi:hypothetical protein
MPPLTSALRLGFVAAAAGLLAACTPTVSDDILTSSLNEKQQAVAIITASLDGSTCSHMNIQLGRKSAQGYEPTTNVQVESGLLSIGRMVVGDIPQVTLPSGQHHIVSYACREGNRVSSVGQIQGRVLGFGGSYVKSMAQFDLAPGEIVNVGHLRISPVGIYGSVTFHVKDQPEAVLTKLKDTKPKLFAQMKTRLMTVQPAQTPEELRRAMCELLAIVAKPGDPTPTSCQTPAGTTSSPAKPPTAMPAGKPATVAAKKAG